LEAFATGLQRQPHCGRQGRIDYYRSVKRRPTNAFEIVRRIGLTLPDVEAATRYDGAPVLKVAGVFMAGLATHASAEPDTLVVRADLEDRESFIEDAPDTYYLTDFYRRYPLVLVRLKRVGRDALRELLMLSHRLTMPKTRLRQRRRRPSGKPIHSRSPWPLRPA
jgi:hypothetical protein